MLFKVLEGHPPLSVSTESYAQGLLILNRYYFVWIFRQFYNFFWDLSAVLFGLDLLSAILFGWDFSPFSFICICLAFSFPPFLIFSSGFYDILFGLDQPPFLNIIFTFSSSGIKDHSLALSDLNTQNLENVFVVLNFK